MGRLGPHVKKKPLPPSCPPVFKILSLSLSPPAAVAAKSPEPMTVDDGRDLQNDPFGPNFFPLFQTLAAEGLQLRTAMEFDTIDSMLRSRALKDPFKFLEQASAVLRSNLESTKFEDASLLLHEDGDQAANANGVDNQQKRRPALGLRRPKFSFKPIQSQPVLLPDPVLSIDHLKDPDKFFAAYERLENAEKELKKSRGDALVDPFEQPKDRKVRPRRQGILGKMANYKHIYPKSAGKVNLVSSQEEMSKVSHVNMTLEVDSNNSSQPESATQPNELQEAEMADVEVVAATKEKANAENQINVLLEELLSTCVDLDGGEMVSLLQDRLHVKPVALDELSFPDLDIIQRNDIKASEESQSRPRKALSDLQQGLRLTANGKTPLRKKPVTRRHKDENFRKLQSSPTPPRSPFASLSMLTKCILQVDPPSDPFALPVEADVQAAEFSCSLQGRMDKEALSHPVSSDHPEKGSLGTSDDSSQRNDGKSLSLNDEMHFKMVEECNATDRDFSSEKVSTADLPVLLDPPVENNSSRFDFGINAISNKGDACSQDKVKDVVPEVSVAQELESSLNLITGTAQCSEDQPEPDLPVSLNTPKDSTSSRFDIEMDTISNEGDACSQDKPQVKVVPLEVPLSQELESSLNVITGTTQCSEDQPEPGTCLAADGHAEGHSDFCKQHDKQDQEVPSTISRRKREKVNELPGKRTKKSRLRGQSLAAAGTKFESGVRRSSRIRSRPLEYWRGERFLYGRIHESLPTIIGIKNASPGKGEGEPVLKVKSFVSEEYAALVELSSLH